jgi:hypothetical protein
MAMTDDHKAALAQGRREASAIKAYLQALGSRKRGRPITPDTLMRRIKDLEARIAAETNPLKAVDLRQARIDAEASLKNLKGSADLPNLEAGFVRHAKTYSSRKDISYAAWREAGVPPAVLAKAGITRSG